jgi:hypothetical protein
MRKQRNMLNHKVRKWRWVVKAHTKLKDFPNDIRTKAPWQAI